MTRLHANKLILKRLERFIEACPEARFWQILSAMKIISWDSKNKPVDAFYEESTTTLYRIPHG